ncbi:methyltransferase domain-containing protein [Nonomuraea soli]|uniref:23S rRNA G2445 N2-methylase RlmL n=1 Tax=Nonomuraea soli TaxID=1032476 RepID=A0A7W0HVG8_9ACTN|nr:methyltransferase domain-containing protein [Nonomuraea soli]MBA2896786.1 23S rRNA G2445 N2-methylase RlmL [Nonomuraea soli]
MFLLARTIRGLEDLACAEIGSPVARVRHREVWFEAARPPGLRIADDLFEIMAVVRDVGPHRTALTRLGEAAAPLRSGEAVDVTASFLGRRTYNRYDVEDAVGTRLSPAYHSRRSGHRPPPGTTSWRVTIEGDEAVIARRLGERPLHRRPYKTGSVPGSLHPPVAAAMARLAGPRGVVLDPCCGAGTLLIEAHALRPGARYLGLDLRKESIAAARSNAPSLAWLASDAGRLPVATGGVDRVLVNPPWNRQVPGEGLIAGLWRELARVLAPGGRIVALLHEPFRERYGLRAVRALPLSLAGSHPTIYEIQPRTSSLTSRGRSR